jgi:hypothetical protein
MLVEVVISKVATLTVIVLAPSLGDISGLIPPFPAVGGPIVIAIVIIVVVAEGSCAANRAMTLLAHSGFAIVGASTLSGRKVSSDFFDRGNAIISRPPNYSARFGISGIVSIVMIIPARSFSSTLLSPPLVFVVGHRGGIGLKVEVGDETKLDKSSAV